jgi:hypothetical protein
MPDSRDTVAARPKVFACVVALASAKSAGDLDGTLPLAKPNHRRDRMLGWNLNAHMHVIHHQVSFDDATPFLHSQIMKDRAQLLSDLSKQGFAPPFGNKDQVVVAFPFGMGQTLVRFCHIASPSVFFIKPPLAEYMAGSLKALPVSLVEPGDYLIPKTYLWYEHYDSCSGY